LKDHSVHPKEAGRSKNGADVVRILNALHQENNTTLKVGYLSHKIARREQLKRPRLNHHTFVVLSGSNPSDLIIFCNLEGNSLALCPLKDVVKCLFSLWGYKDPFNVCPTMLKDRKTTLHTVVLCALFTVEMRRFVLGSTSPSLPLCGTRL
jgi:hypothetical protein